MAKYRKRPIEVEAEQWFPGKDVPGVYREDPDAANLGSYDDREHPSAEVRHFVVTIHRQRAYLDPGDWVVTEPDGIHHYPCKDEIFRATYEDSSDHPRRSS